MQLDTGLAIRVYVVELGEDDPRRCTARKMIRHGYAIRVSKPPAKTIVLDPFSLTPITRSDEVIARSAGVTVLDGSWRQGEKLTRAARRTRGVHRRLPLLFAANPQHYGWLYKLSSLEAVAATLYILGFRDDAEKLLGLYKWGRTFLELNQELLDAYSKARNVDEILETEAELLSKILEESIAPDKVNLIISRLVTKDYYNMI